MRGVTFLFRVLLVVGIPLAIAAGVFFFLKKTFLDPMQPGVTAPVSFMVEPGTSFQQISGRLAAEGFVAYPIVPRLIARIREIDTRSIKAGEYALSFGMSPLAILNKLASGDIVRRRVTVTEGMTVRDIARVVAAAGLLKEEEFLRISQDPLLLKKWGVIADSFEGYLYPETYFFSLPLRGEDVIATMLKEGEKIWPEEYTSQAERLSLTRHQVLTLASIIEKESGDPVEQKLISSVFHNRLDRGMRLQSDPTVIYGIPNFNGNLTKSDLETPTPYNTYTNEGLPPGPIGSPGRGAIQAALFPAQSDYLYFVADGTGNHTFSAGLQEHNRAVRQLVGRDDRPQTEAPVSPAPFPSDTAGLRQQPKSPVIRLIPGRR